MKYLLISAVLMITFGELATAQQQIDKTLLHDGNMRQYTVYVPASYQGTSPTPLLFNFHGGSGDIASQIAIADMRSIADTANFIVVYPQAWPDPNDGGSTNWTHKTPTAHDDATFVEAMIDALATEYAIDQNRVYACGYSNGGEFSFELACNLSHRIAAIGVVARSMFIDTYNDCAPAHPTAVITIHGTNDDYNGLIWAGTTFYLPLDSVNQYWSTYNNTTQSPSILQIADKNSTDGSTVELFSWDDGDGCVSVRHYKVNGGGHDWPGSFGNMDIDATEEIWNFVSQYNINGLIGCGTTSVENIRSEEQVVMAYPNPASDVVTIEIDRVQSTGFQIYSTSGELKSSGTIHSKKKVINTSGLPSGVYFLKIGKRMVKLIKT